MYRLSLTLLFVFCLQIVIAQTPIYSSEATHHPVVAESGMVATQHKIATEVGLEILKQGGNAIDAAVAIGFALAVVLPRAGNLGGGGFMIVHDADTKSTKAIDYREIAPANSSRDMYLDKKGEVDIEKFNQSHFSVGVPGSVAGMIHALETYGTMELETVLEPAISLATLGFEVTNDLAWLLVKYEDRLKKCPNAKDIFYRGDSFYEAGDTLKQKDLAWSLTQIAREGTKAFYRGEVGKKLVQDIQSNGGPMTVQDLESYKVNVTEPVWGTYKGYDVASMPPPSSGGVHLIQMLNILEPMSLDSLQHNSSETIHLMVEAMRYAYADRSEHLGDPSFWDIPVKGLLSKDYATEIRKKMNKKEAALSSEVKPGNPEDYESEETTHFSVADKFGNVVSNTYTLNFSFGSGFVAKGTGILLNNEMGDFSAKPGSANAYGLIGGEANAVEPGKRPLSSMTPAIVFKDKAPFLVTGSPGGSRIITTVLQVVLNVIEHKMNIAEATHAARIHHQWFPDVLYYEAYFSPETRNSLESKGHTLKKRAAMGSSQSILMRDGLFFGASDPRRPDGRALGY